MLKIFGRILIVLLVTSLLAGLVYWGFEAIQPASTVSLESGGEISLSGNTEGFHQNGEGGGLRDGSGRGNGEGFREDENIPSLTLIGLGQDILIIAGATAGVSLVKYLLRKRKSIRISAA